MAALLPPAALRLCGNISRAVSPTRAAPCVRRSVDTLPFLHDDLHVSAGPAPREKEEDEGEEKKKRKKRGKKKGRRRTVMTASSTATSPNSTIVLSPPAYCSSCSSCSSSTSSSFSSSLSLLLSASAGSLSPATSLRDVLHASGGASRQRGIFALFGTVERADVSVFTSLFREHRALLDPLMERVLRRCDGLYPSEVNILDFLRHPHTIPSAEFFHDPLLSWPLHVLYATSCFYVTARRYGYRETFEALRQRGAVFVTGKSLFGALAVSMSPTEDELAHHTARMFRAAFFVGLSLRELSAPLHASLRRCAAPRFLLLVVNLSLAALRLLVDRVNAVPDDDSDDPDPNHKDNHKDDHNSDGEANNHDPHNDSSNDNNGIGIGIGLRGGGVPFSRVSFSRVLGPRAAVLCGHPQDLRRLRRLLLRCASFSGAGAAVHHRLLPAPAPEHSAHFAAALPLQLLRLWRAHRVRLREAELQLVIRSPVDGRPWGGERRGRAEGWAEAKAETFAERVARAATCEAQDLTHATRQLRDGDALLNFSASAISVGELAAGTRRGVSVIMQPSDRVARGPFLSPRRGSGVLAMRATFAKCAVINQVLRSMQWDSPEGKACVTELTASFVEMGLLHKRCPNTRDRSLTGMADKARVNRSAERQGRLHTSKEMRDRRRVVSGAAGNHNNINHHHRNHSSSGAADDGDDYDEDGGCSHYSSGAAIDSTMDAQNFVISPNEEIPSAVNVYQVSPLIKYYELQTNCVLTYMAVDFAQRLSQVTGLAFPPHTLLMCPTVFALLELWDTFAFLCSKGE